MKSIFESDEKTIRKICGKTIGTKFAPSNANLFMLTSKKTKQNKKQIRLLIGI